jgi:hypothetical protein
LANFPAERLREGGVVCLFMSQKLEALPPLGVLADFIVLVISIAKIFDHGVERICSQPLKDAKKPHEIPPLMPPHASEGTPNSPG